MHRFNKLVTDLGMNFKDYHTDPGDATVTSGEESAPGPSVVPRADGMPKKFIRLMYGEGEYLSIVAQRARVGILEIGRFAGGSTLLLAMASKHCVPVHSIDLQPRDDALLRQFLIRHKVDDRVTLHVGNSQEDWGDAVPEFDVCFVDGDHSEEGCLADLERWWPRLTAGGHMLVHDCHRTAVRTAVLDFLQYRAEVKVWLSPYVLSSFRQAPTGSLAHFSKPSGKVSA